VPELTESTEMIDELIMDSVKRGETVRGSPRWHSRVGMSTLVMALLTAIGSLLTGMTAHETLLERTEEIIAVATCQGNRTTVEVLKSKHELQGSLGETPDKNELARISAYEAEAIELEANARLDEDDTQSVAYPHLIFAVAVTLLAIGTSLSGMAIITGQKVLWYVGIVFGIFGAIGLGAGIVMM